MRTLYFVNFEKNAIDSIRDVKIGLIIITELWKGFSKFDETMSINRAKTLKSSKIGLSLIP